jgi:hypothetical protein
MCEWLLKRAKDLADLRTLVKTITSFSPTKKNLLPCRLSLLSVEYADNQCGPWLPQTECLTEPKRTALWLLLFE